MAAVHLSRIGKSFGTVRVLESIDLDVKDGEFVALLGPSGCGKSTLIRIVAGLEAPDRGEVRLGERLVFGPGVTLPPEERGLGMVFQSYAVWPHRTVRENVGYPLKIRKMDRAEAAKEIERALELVRLTGLGDRYPHELSGGQQQRVALARALVARPQVLLLDEPLSNLDARLREEMRGELSELSQRLKITVILVTHDQAEALSTANRVAVMRAGHIVQLDSPETIYRAPADLYVAQTVGAVNALPLIGFEPSEDGVLALAQSDIRCLVHGRPEGLTDPAEWVLAVRPESVAFDDGGGIECEVLSRAFLGDRVDLTLKRGDVQLRATTSAARAPAPGTTARVHFEAPLLLRR